LFFHLNQNPNLQKVTNKFMAFASFCQPINDTE
jgi:hypothetical protein